MWRLARSTLALLGFSSGNPSPQNQFEQQLLFSSASTSEFTNMSCKYETVGLVCSPVDSQIMVKQRHLQGAGKAASLTMKQKAIYSVATILLILISGLMSGLTVGLASIDRLGLEIDAKASVVAKKAAEKIFPVIDQHHWMLVTLLLCNAVAVEALPLCLDQLVPSVVAIVISVTGVLAFGEIIPQALCTGPSQIKIAVCFCPVVKVLMWLTCPLSWPIGKLLDKLMGEHTIQRFDNDQLRYLILLHSKQALAQMDHMPEDIEGLNFDQARIIEGALQLNELKTSEIMSTIVNVVIVHMDMVLDDDTLEKLKQIGFSRIPISYSANQRSIFGIMLMKSLVGYTIRNETIKQAIINNHISVRVPLFFTEQTNMSDVCRAFKEGHSHMGLICESGDAARNNRNFADQVMASLTSGKDYAATVESLDQLSEQNLFGVITLENVVERILQMDIKDEKDADYLQRFSTQIAPPTSQVLTRPRTISKANLNQYYRNPSMLYEEEEEETSDNPAMMRNASVNHVFTSKFMLNFAQNLEQLIRTDIKELNGKSDLVLRSLSRAGSHTGFLTEDLDLGASSRLKKSVSDMGPGFTTRLNNTEVVMEISENRNSGKFSEVPDEV